MSLSKLETFKILCKGVDLVVVFLKNDLEVKLLEKEPVVGSLKQFLVVHFRLNFVLYRLTQKGEGFDVWELKELQDDEVLVLV